MCTIFWAGDSTVQTNDYTTYPQTGIGQVFSLFLKENCRVENHAKNGRSTKSFIREGRLRDIEARIGQGIFSLSSLATMTRSRRIPPGIRNPFPLL